jgi:hypothetical protein
VTPKTTEKIRTSAEKVGQKTCQLAHVVYLSIRSQTELGLSSEFPWSEASEVDVLAARFEPKILLLLEPKKVTFFFNYFSEFSCCGQQSFD